MTESPAKPVGRVWQFALPAALLTLGVLGGFFAWSVNQVRQRDRMLTEIELAEGSVVLPEGEGQSAALRENLPIVWRICGAKPVWWLLLPEQGLSGADRTRIRKLFPEARVGSVSGAGKPNE